MSTWIASHKFFYWLMTAAIVLGIVLPVWATGHKPMWPVSVSTVIIVGGTAALIPRLPRLRAWFRHRNS
jgi:hypothetical protein